MLTIQYIFYKNNVFFLILKKIIYKQYIVCFVKKQKHG